MITDTRLPLLIPQWPAPENIKAVSTLRFPGVSSGVYTAFNLALHTGDNREAVLKNREDLIRCAHLPASPKWLNQTHSDIALPAHTIGADILPTGDASYTQTANTVCVVMTADCLPILLTNKQGTEVAAIHAGWQGLAGGVIESTLSKLSSTAESLLIWIGPSIQQAHYEVDEDFYAAFAKLHTPQEMDAAFSMQANQKYLANVPLLAVQRLIRCGINVNDIYLSNECTYAHSEKYFSYRRDGITGRMASLIFISDAAR